jgi:hypothetical protein
MELEDNGQDKTELILRDGAWNFATEMRGDGEWAVFSMPINPGFEGADVFHALTLQAVVLDMHGVINEDTNHAWDFLLEGGES